MDAQVKLESKVVFDQNANRIMAHAREWISLHDCGDGIHGTDKLTILNQRISTKTYFISLLYISKTQRHSL